MEELRFHTAGIPFSTKPNKSTLNALDRIRELGLHGMELEYTRGIILDYPKLREVGLKAKSLGLTLTAHAPYYINLFADDRKKVERSIEQIMDTARLLDAAGGYSVVFHAAYYLGQQPHKVYPEVLRQVQALAALAKKEALKVGIRPELMGKPSQFGTLEEVVHLSEDAGGNILPCIDFAHLHARTGKYNTYEEFASAFEFIAKRLGDEALREMHIHFSGIRYSAKGEQKHLIVRESDFRYREFLKCLKDYDICGVMVVESPNVEGDALWLKKIYQTM